MTKFLLGVAIVAFTSFCGYILTKKYRKRKLFFTQLNEFNERFLSEISYYRRPIAEFASKYTYKGEFNEFLEKYFEYIDETPRFFEEVFASEGFTFLTAEEKTVLRDYFSMLGKGNSASQQAYFSSVKERLIKLKTEAEAACKRYGDLYIKLGFLCGLLILILII
ncbi:MAG: stage III sporulation protein AB [Clostridia bacterium]|nr:stage III sporulation protein AB [Clostridia bacterium]